MEKFNPIGQRFNSWLVIKRYGKQGKQPTWLCVCDCGNEGIIPSYNLKSGRSTNCGCKRKETLSKMNTTHGMTNSRLYNIWLNMKRRCYSLNASDYGRYGGRGITVCKEWYNDFQVFYDWSVQNGYTSKLTIDRIDNNGNYAPSNCRWTTRKIQANNSSHNHFITFKEERKTLSEWCCELNLNYHTIKRRIFRGWEIDKAFLTPVRKVK
jgi:hypothetical protein